MVIVVVPVVVMAVVVVVVVVVVVRHLISHRSSYPGELYRNELKIAEIHCTCIPMFISGGFAALQQLLFVQRCSFHKKRVCAGCPSHCSVLGTIGLIILSTKKK